MNGLSIIFISFFLSSQPNHFSLLYIFNDERVALFPPFPFFKSSADCVDLAFVAVVQGGLLRLRFSVDVPSDAGALQAHRCSTSEPCVSRSGSGEPFPIERC